MRIEASIVAEWASQLSKDAVAQVVEQLMSMKPEMMQSSGTGLKNVWEEFCAQIQQEKSVFYDAYEVIIDRILEQYIQTLSRKAQLALWSTADQGWDWIYENFADSDGDRKAPLDTNLIIDCLRHDVMDAALDYESRTLYKYIWGSDDAEYDDESQEEASVKDTHDKVNATSGLVAWAPQGYSAPIELIAVRIKQGKVTEREWWEALSDRVSQLAIEAGEGQTMAACNALDVPMTEELYQAGQSLVLHNLVLIQALDLNLIDENPVPAVVSESSEEAEEALTLTLGEWAGHALSMVSTSSLD